MDLISLTVSSTSMPRRRRYHLLPSIDLQTSFTSVDSLAFIKSVGVKIFTAFKRACMRVLMPGRSISLRLAKIWRWLALVISSIPSGLCSSAAVLARKRLLAIPTLQRIWQPISVRRRCLISVPMSSGEREAWSRGRFVRSIIPSSIDFIMTSLE